MAQFLAVKPFIWGRVVNTIIWTVQWSKSRLWLGHYSALSRWWRASQGIGIVGGLLKWKREFNLFSSILTWRLMALSLSLCTSAFAYIDNVLVVWHVENQTLGSEFVFGYFVKMVVKCELFLISMTSVVNKSFVCAVWQWLSVSNGRGSFRIECKEMCWFEL